MTWPLVFGNDDVVTRYDISAIPSIFLIDPEGRIIYKSREATEKGFVSYDDAQLSKLDGLLEKRLNRH